MTATDKNIAYVHGDFVPLNQAYVHISDLAVQRGYGVFDFFRVEAGHPYFLELYLDRFYASAGLLELEVPLTRPAIKEVIYTLIHENNLPVSGIKMILTGGYSADGYTPAAPNLLLTQQEIALPGLELLERGVSVLTHEYVREIPRAKTINYTMGILLQKEIKAAHKYDVLYHAQGLVTEFPRSNFFLVTPDNRLVTPDADVLAGITRHNVLSLARKHYEVEVRPVRVPELAQAKEAFTTSTTKRLLPIVQINDWIIGEGRPGEITKTLLQELIALEAKDRKQPVYQP